MFLQNLNRPLFYLNRFRVHNQCQKLTNMFKRLRQSVQNANEILPVTSIFECISAGDHGFAKRYPCMSVKKARVTGITLYTTVFVDSALLITNKQLQKRCCCVLAVKLNTKSDDN